MSAFICDNSHITALAVYATRNKLTTKTALETGVMLLAENVASVNYRYRESERHAFELCELAAFAQLSPVQIIKAADCLDYQSCEHDAWPDSEACKLLEAIAAHAALSLPERYATAKNDDIPGYTAAVWEITPASFKLCA